MYPQSDDFDKYYIKILNFISYKPRTKCEVLDRLNKYKTPKDVIPEILATLESENYLNDREYLELYIRGLTKPLSVLQLKNFLYKKNLEKNLLDNFEEFLAEDYEKTAALKLARKKQKILDETKLRKYLYSKGFRRESIDYAFDTLEDLK